MASIGPRVEDGAMNSDLRLVDDHARDLLQAARAFQAAAAPPGSTEVAPAALGSLEEALQVLSKSWYQLAADAPPSRAPVVHLIGEGVPGSNPGVGFASCSRGAGSIL
jgi:hypothetical protein